MPNSTPPADPPRVPCPHCAAPQDVSARITGDTVCCAACDRWYVVYFRPGGVLLMRVVR